MRAEEVGRLRREVGELKGLVENRIATLEHGIEKLRTSQQEAAGAQARQTRGVQERLKKIEELLEARSAELSGAQIFLPTADRLSEMEVLSIVRDLNENIFQVAVGLTEGWEKLEPPQATGPIEVDLTSQSRDPVLVQLTRKRDPTGLNFLLQLHLCYLAVKVTSSWVHDPELDVLQRIYQGLSASGEHHIIDTKQYPTHIRTTEGQAISARWRSLTHTYLSRSPPDPASLVGPLARVFDETGTFSSPQQSFEFVRKVALERIESMIRTAQRLKAAFMVDVTSSDMALLFDAPDAVFDEARMTNEFGPDSGSKCGKRDRIAGTTEVGVEKSICGNSGGARRAEILLKTKVVLEKDVVGDGGWR